MTADTFAEWLRRQGRRVLRTTSTYWHSQGLGIYVAFPYHWLIRPSKDELREMFERHHAVGLRYSASLESPVGRVSYHVVYDRGAHELADLGKWARKNVRRGLRGCRVEPISFERLAEEGWELQQETLHRQGRARKMSHEAWSRKCWAAIDLPGFQAWGALVQERLAAAVITFQMQDCCYMLYQECRTEYLSQHVNNALSFVVTQSLIGQAEVRLILYGMEAPDAPTTVDEFKFRMGYSATPVRQCVAFHPWLSPLLGRASHALLRLAKNVWPRSVRVSVGEGILRFYLEGNLPVGEQLLPEPLQQISATLRIDLSKAIRQFPER